MSEFDSTAMGFSAVLACIVSAIFTAVTCLAETQAAFKVVRPRLFMLGVIITTTGWIWGPWAGYSIWWTYEKSTSGVNYVQRPAEVIPENRKVIDLNKPERK